MTNKNLILSWFSLFTSFGTIFCCALPALLVFLGLGAGFAGLIGLFPQIVWLSENKILIFGFSALLISLGFLSNYFNRETSCPADPSQVQSCQKAKEWSVRILVFSASLWFLGAFVAFILPNLYSF